MNATNQLSPTRKFFRNLRKDVVYHGIVGIIALVMLYPIIWMFSSSFKSPEDITNVNSIIPQSLYLENYSNGWQGFGDYSFAVFYENSLKYAVIGSTMHVVMSAIIAYGFARLRFRGKQMWFSIMLLTLMLPPQVIIIPQYIIFSKLDMVNSFAPLLLPRIGGEAFFIFMIVQFIRGIPIDLDEAGMIDGCSKIGVFRYIILPQLKPAIITAAIFSFYWTWNDFLGPLIYLTKPEQYTVSVALRAFADPSGMTDWGAIFAMLSLSLVPVFIIFILFQRYLVEGISTTGLKG